MTTSTETENMSNSINETDLHTFQVSTTGRGLTYMNPVFSGRNFPLNERLCFVLMPLHDPFTSIFESHIKPMVEKCGLSAVKADDIYSNKPVMQDVWAYLNQARLVIADLTDSNPNVFYELGIAHTIGKEVIMIAQHITKVPFDVGHVRYINYQYPSRVAEFETNLERTIKQVLKDSSVEIRLGTDYERKIKQPKRQSSIPRVERLSELAIWSRNWTESNFLKLVERGSTSDAGFAHILPEWEIFERISSEVRTEAVKRWSLSSGTAKDYADTVMLGVDSEFRSRIHEAVERRDSIREKERRGANERRGLAKQTFEKLSNQGRTSVDKSEFLRELTSTGKFTSEQASSEIKHMITLSEIVETSKKNFALRGWSRDFDF